MPRDMNIAALIPVKGFVHAKQRLAPLVNAAERALLAEAMLKDTLQQTLAAPALAATFVVTSDPQAGAIASSFGARIIWQEAERGETNAVDFARTQLKQQGLSTTLILPADIPLLQSADIELLLAYPLLSPGALLVPSHDRLGTNALLLSPPDIIQLRFGYDSFAYHLQQVALRGLTQRVLENDRIALDIDEPSDLMRLIKLAQSGQTRRCLLELKIAERTIEQRS
ncbi:MAG: 2-phospho-L-lactate guanylyltransferase [Candidatus Binatia bacterium]